MKRIAQLARPAALRRGGFAVVRQAFALIGGFLPSQLWSQPSLSDCRTHSAAPVVGMSYERPNTTRKPQAFGTLVQV
jgi:hypothetical protein